MNADTLPDAKPPRNLTKVALKAILTLLVLAFVGRRTWHLIEGQDLSEISVCPGWLAASALFYGLGWLPSIWFWRNLMSTLGGTPPWLFSGKAYFAGHLGKYIPGKAGVLLIRAAMLKERGHQFGAAALTAAYETLVMMGVGLVVAGSLAPLLVPETTLTDHAPWVIGWRWVPGVILVVAAVLALPLVTWLLSWVAGKFSGSSEVTVRISSRQLLKGYAVFLITWICLGLSLGAALQSLSDDWLSLADLPLWIAAVSASTVIGFFAVFAPGGLGVREGIMIEILRIQPEISAEEAALASWILRVIWLVTEALGFCLFWMLVRWSERRTNSAA
ncbi:MAG: flippase-like domain-containing protein [Planctomycetaceae bacterium]|nr:flippase-like domain-containing protein [Planctomycetaceae bacterium]